MGLKEDYIKEIKTWDWKALVAECEANVCENDDGDPVGMSYLGSVMSLVPSGKYYTPFASSNVDACEKCSGEGSIPNPNSDPARHEILTSRVQDLIGPLLKEHGAHPNWPAEEKEKVEKARAGQEECKPTLDCETCGCLGSEEAFKDQEWYEALGEVAESHDCYYTEGDGCATDLYIGMSIETEETTA